MRRLQIMLAPSRFLHACRDHRCPRETPVDFQRDIRPILSNHCFKCHGPALQKSGVRLDSHEASAQAQGDRAGQSRGSKVIDAFSPTTTSACRPRMSAND